jgi:hypothetical protein
MSFNDQVRRSELRDLGDAHHPNVFLVNKYFSGSRLESADQKMARLPAFAHLARKA